jgi:hypothetical protein
MIEVSDVEQDRHEYTCRCGWIDWGHAEPGREDVVSLWEQFPGTTGSNTDSLETDGGTLWRVKHKSEVPPGWKGKLARLAMPSLRAYFVRDFGRKPDAYKGIALAIYMKACEDFEDIQDFAEDLGFGSHSAFSFEDLPSNLLAFYQVVNDLISDKTVKKIRETPRVVVNETVRSLCCAVGKETSVALAKLMEKLGQNTGTNHDWFQPRLFDELLKQLPQPHNTACDQCARGFPSEFQTIHPTSISKKMNRGDVWEYWSAEKEISRTNPYTLPRGLRR